MKRHFGGFNAKKQVVWVRDALPKIRLCTAVKIQTGILPSILCTNWRIHRPVSCNKKGYFYVPRLLQWKNMHCFQTRCILLVFSFYHFLAYGFILRTTVSCCSEMKYVPVPKVPRVHLPFHISVGTTDPMMGLVQPSRSVMSDSVQPHELQHARPPCPSPTPGACSNSCPSSQWCHPSISSSVVPFSRLQSFPASGSFQMSQFLVSGSQSFGVPASASVLPMNIQDWFPLGWDIQVFSQLWGDQ